MSVNSFLGIRQKKEIIFERVACTEHNHDSMRARGVIMLNQGKYKEALEIFEVVNEYEKINLGENHQVSLVTKSRIAKCLPLGQVNILRQRNCYGLYTIVKQNCLVITTEIH